MFVARVAWAAIAARRVPDSAGVRHRVPRRVPDSVCVTPQAFVTEFRGECQTPYADQRVPTPTRIVVGEGTSRGPTSSSAIQRSPCPATTSSRTPRAVGFSIG